MLINKPGAEFLYGYDPKYLDLSRIEIWDDFVKAMNYAMMKQFSALENGGRMAVLMGASKRKADFTVCLPRS